VEGGGQGQSKKTKGSKSSCRMGKVGVLTLAKVWETAVVPKGETLDWGPGKGYLGGTEVRSLEVNPCNMKEKVFWGGLTQATTGFVGRQ